jgi:hypothetical protein
LHHGGDPLAPLVVRQADDGAVLNRRVLHDRLLDLGGVDVEAAGDHHVLRAVDDEQEVVVVEVTDVPGVVPAEGGGLRGRPRVAVVAAHHQRAAHDDLPGLPALQKRSVRGHDGQGDQR